MQIYISSDHGGFKLKNFLLTSLQNKGFSIEDTGPFELNPADNYPEITINAIKKVQENSNDRAILICRNGVGVTIFANRFTGVRAGLSWDKKHAASHRNDDDTNILCLPADYIDEETAVETTLTWLETVFSNEERHKNRLGQIEQFSQDQRNQQDL